MSRAPRVQWAGTSPVLRRKRGLVPTLRARWARLRRRASTVNPSALVDRWRTPTLTVGAAVSFIVSAAVTFGPGAAWAVTALSFLAVESLMSDDGEP